MYLRLYTFSVLFCLTARRRVRLAAFTAALAAAGVGGVEAATFSSYSVRASAVVQTSPPSIILSWPQAGAGLVNTYAISRKDPAAGSWTPVANLVGNATSYADTNVIPGQLYEYQIEKRTLAFTGYGYLTAGMDLPAVDHRGKVILVVDDSMAGSLATELQVITEDLIGDGWMVIRRDVGRGDLPSAVRAAIRTEYNADPSNVKAAILIGHVPVVKSGNLNVDGHRERPLPADSFYGDMDGNWTDANGDGVYDNNTIPSDIELMVGRIDFADMPGAAGVNPFPGEAALLQRYLRKSHDFRHARIRVAPRALVGDRIGDSNGEAFVASAYGAFAAFFGPDRTTLANVEDNSPAGERWIAKLTSADYLWVFGGGGGSATSMSGLGQRGQYFDVWSTDLVENKARGTFYLLFGSWLMDWSQADNLMRAALAAPDYGLTAAWSGRPHLYFHPMAMGETTGHGIRLSQNNVTLYKNQVNHFTRGIHIALMGDPTLRLHVVAPPRELKATEDGAAPTLSWQGSPDADAGYHIYRSANQGGPFTRVTNVPLAAMSFTDDAAPVGDNFYMVRGIRREISGSGTYYNSSQGLFAKVTVKNSVSTIPAGASGAGSTPVSASGTPNQNSGGSNPVASSARGGGGAVSPVFAIALIILLVARQSRRGRERFPAHDDDFENDITVHPCRRRSGQVG